MDLGARIAAWRWVRSMSQRALAQEVGVTHSAVCQWEDPEEKSASPSQAHFAKVVDAFGITMVQFWGDIPKRKRAA